jgi:hypothetical protein
MIKKYLYAGAVLLIIAVVVLYSVSSFITSGSPTSIVNLTVLGGSIGYAPIQVNATSVSIIFVFASNLTNVYFLNQSMFNGLSGYLNGNSLRSAYSYVIAHNVSKTDIFQDNESAIKEEYQLNNSASNYYVYAVVDSTSGSPSHNSIVNASVVYKAYTYNTWISKSGESLVGIAAFILGVALMIYGALKKPKVVAEDAAPAEKPKARKAGGKG